MNEIITLIGGPLDGQQFNWSSSDDTARFSIVPTARPVGMRQRQDPPELTYSTYRRSIVTRTMFVFQP